MADCLLCTAAEVTPWHHQDDLCWIADCLVCATPMVVWRKHGLPDAATRAAMIERLSKVADDVYPEGWWLDGEMRQIPDHFHAHARPKDGFFGSRGRQFPT